MDSTGKPTKKSIIDALADLGLVLNATIDEVKRLKKKQKSLKSNVKSQKTAPRHVSPPKPSPSTTSEQEILRTKALNMLRF